MRKNKITAFIVLTTLNILLVKIFNLKISVQNIITIQAFLFSLLFLSQLLQEKLLKNKKTTPAHFLSINILRIALSVIFLLPVILNFRESFSYANQEVSSWKTNLDKKVNRDGNFKSSWEDSQKGDISKVEFPTFKDAERCYNSDEYQEAHNILKSSVKRNLQIIEGI